MRTFCKRALLIVLPIALLAGALELLGWILLPPPPAPGSAEARTKTFNDTFYEPDPELVVRLRRNLATTFAFLSPEHDVPVHTNAAGFRGADFEPPDPHALRILVLGDSVTFGLLLPFLDTWPELMARTLRAHTARRIQVRNLAVPGYSTFQGRLLLERALHDSFAPHVVLFAFGFNDSFLRTEDDRTLQQSYAFLHGSTLGSLVSLLQQTHFGRFLAARAARRPPTTPRVPPEQLADNLEAAATAQHGAELVLADSDIPNTYPHALMAAAASRHHLPFVSFRDIFARAKSMPTPPPWSRAGVVRIALHTGGVPVPPSPDARPAAYLLLLPDATRRLDVRRIALHDDGHDGDLTPHDAIWSCLVELQAQARPEYAFGIPGLAPQLPAMADDAAIENGIHFTTLAPPSGATGEPATLDVFAPNVVPWPDLVLVPDPIHPTAAGSRLIAQAMADAVMATTAWRR